MDDLVQEYLFLLETYESYNDQSLIIKGWSASVGMAALLAVYAAKPAELSGRFMVLLAACSVLPFYMTDALWKALQSGYVFRLEELEKAIAAGGGSAMQSFTTWEREFALTSVQYMEALRNPAVFLPHLPIVFAGSVLAQFYPPPQGGKDAGHRSPGPKATAGVPAETEVD